VPSASAPSDLVDCDQIVELAADPNVRARAARFARARQSEFLLLGVDRLDYTKGIQQRIKAIAEMLDDGLLSAERQVMIQIAVRAVSRTRTTSRSVTTWSARSAK